MNHGYSKVFDRGAWGSYTERSITDFDLEDTPPMIHVKCNFQLFPTEKGGREFSVKNGYRPDHGFEYEQDGRAEYAFIGDLQFDEGDEIIPGESKSIVVRFLTHQPIEQYLSIGRKWWIHEGPNVVAEAEVLSIELPITEK